MKFKLLFFLAFTYSLHASLENSTLSDFLGSSDKSLYQVTSKTFGSALISINGELKPSAFEPIQMMKSIWADPAQNDFPVEDMSHEYLLFRLGADYLYTFSHYVESFREASDLARTYREAAPTLDPILKFIHPLNRAEMDCMHVNWTNNSCPDVFKDGLQEDEVVCSEQNENLIRCHVECRNALDVGEDIGYELGLCKK